MQPHTYPGQRCLRRLPEEDQCRAGTHSGPHRRVTHWTETHAVRCQRNSPAGTGCPSELWGYMQGRDSEATVYRDMDMRHAARRTTRRGEQTRQKKNENEPSEEQWSAALLCAFSLIE